MHSFSASNVCAICHSTDPIFIAQSFGSFSRLVHRVNAEILKINVVFCNFNELVIWSSFVSHIFICLHPLVFQIYALHSLDFFHLAIRINFKENTFFIATECVSSFSEAFRLSFRYRNKSLAWHTHAISLFNFT